VSIFYKEKKKKKYKYEMKFLGVKVFLPIMNEDSFNSCKYDLNMEKKFVIKATEKI
jgi:hypothetical protein